MTALFSYDCFRIVFFHWNIENYRSFVCIHTIKLFKKKEKKRKEKSIMTCRSNEASLLCNQKGLGE